MMKVNTVAIVHGESERILVKDISNKLRYPIEIFPEKSTSTVDLPNVGHILGTKPFTSERELHKMFPKLDYVPGKICKIPDLKIFPIIDVDQHQGFRKSFCSKDLFRDCPLKDAIVPVINDPNLDEVLKGAGLDVNVNSKVKSYSELVRNLEYPSLYDVLKNNPNTGIDVLILRALAHSPPYQSKYREEYLSRFV